jgi:hypothetical protein
MAGEHDDASPLIQSPIEMVQPETDSIHPRTWVGSFWIT